MRHLQELHTQYKDKGLVILGFNPSDDKQIALDMLRENGALNEAALEKATADLVAAYGD